MRANDPFILPTSYFPLCRASFRALELYPELLKDGYTGGYTGDYHRAY